MIDLLKYIHEDCIDILRDIDKVCRSNGIKYSLCGGSVIGAKLFNDIIPWDDDVDLMMDRQNYDKFLEVYSKEKKSKYAIVNYNLVNCEDVPALFSRIVDMDTEVVEKIGAGDQKIGHVFVDITVFDNVKNKFSYKINELFRYYVYSFYYKINNIVPGNKYKRMIYKLFGKARYGSKLYKTYKNYDNYCSRYKMRNTKYCAELLGTIFPGRIYTKDIFNEYIDIQFSDIKAMIIKDYDKYLFQRYNRTEFTKENKAGNHTHIISYRRLK